MNSPLDYYMNIWKRMINENRYTPTDEMLGEQCIQEKGQNSGDVDTADFIKKSIDDDAKKLGLGSEKYDESCSQDGCKPVKEGFADYVSNVRVQEVIGNTRFGDLRAKVQIFKGSDKNPPVEEITFKHKSSIQAMSREQKEEYKKQAHGLSVEDIIQLMMKEDKDVKQAITVLLKNSYGMEDDSLSKDKDDDDFDSDSSGGKRGNEDDYEGNTGDDEEVLDREKDRLPGLSVRDQKDMDKDY